MQPTLKLCAKGGYMNRPLKVLSYPLSAERGLGASLALILGFSKVLDKKNHSSQE